ncbi:hypothetical protein [Microbacterium sp. NC79]|nr:hypothetical protein [Microbacterium sp. NC79]MBV0895941.1 hypothetical protein [Microbacterium sp. NC79]
MKRHAFVIVTALIIGITLSACGPVPAHVDDEIANIGRGISRLFDKNIDS